MSQNLPFEFIADKENNTLTIRRTFDAAKPLVWDCYTKSELLEQWFAPKPLTAKTKTMDFREGGFWLYAMIEPNGTEHWGRTDFLKIQPIDYYTSLDGFCDDEGNLNPDLPRAEWKVSFIDTGDQCMVESVSIYPSQEALETVVKMGMEEGMKSTWTRLDELLLSIKTPS